MKKSVFIPLDIVEQLKEQKVLKQDDTFVKELFAKDIKDFERTWDSEIHQASLGDIPEWQADSLSLLARKFELVEELLSLEKDYPLMPQRLSNYRNALKHAIQSRLKD